MPSLGQRIGFLGAGKMGTALAQGLINAGLATAAQLRASDPVDEARQAFRKSTGAALADSNSDLVANSDIIILAVKPDTVKSALDEVRLHWKPEQLLISIAAGVTLSRLEGYLGGQPRVVRVMPNTPALVGSSATAYALGKYARESDSDLAQNIFSSVGIAHEVKESLLDAITGLSGSGPAYAYTIIEALSDGGVAAGLPRDIATRFAAQTLLGSAKMVLESSQHPGALRDMVTSPGGTTIEGLHELEKGGLRAALMNAVRAAAEKSRKLGQG